MLGNSKVYILIMGSDFTWGTMVIICARYHMVMDFADQIRVNRPGIG